MSRISALPPIADEALNGDETVPVVKEDTTYRARLAALAEAAVAPIARIVMEVDGDFSNFSFAIADDAGAVLELYDDDGRPTGSGFDAYDDEFSDISAAQVAIAGDASVVFQALRANGETEFPGGVGTRQYVTIDLDDDFADFGLYAVVDGAGRVLQRIDAEGRTQISFGEVSASLLAPTTRRPRVHETFGLDINHHIMNGQSNSVRNGTYLAIQDASDMAFSGGIELREEEVANSLVGIGDVPAQHAIIFNAAQQLKFLITGGGSYSPDDDFVNGSYPVLISSHGTGGASIANLSKGGTTGSYEDALHGVAEAARIAREAGKACSVQSLCWVQGETDRNLSVSAYKAAFLAMLADYRADIGVETAQASTFVTFVLQPSGQQFDAPAGQPFPNRVAQAFFEISEEDTHVLIAGPTYPLGHVDDLHYDSGYRAIGMQLGKALYKRVYRGEDWRPLEPRRITQHSARVLSIKFDVPEGPLVFDTDTVTDPGDYGFTLEDDAGTIALSSVQIVNADTVRITTSADIGSNPKLAYAFYGIGGNGGGPTEGARGNLRDSDATVGADGSSTLWNWAVAFQKPIPYSKGS